MRLLALDVGNTSITAGIFDGRRLAREFRVPTRSHARPAQLGAALAAGAGRYLHVDAAVYGSVVPTINRALERAVANRFGRKPEHVGPLSPLGIKLKVKRPREVGADRVLNALGAFARVKGAAVVVDFGTATTFDCVSPKGDYLGGAILPGPRMAAQALSSGTAQLPLVAVKKPRRVVGRDTIECIEAGLYYGYLGMIEKILKLTLKELGGRPAVLVTGGLSGLFIKEFPGPVSWVPGLTLEGLRIAHDRLAGRKS